MDWILIWEIVYTVLLVLVCLKAIYDTGSNTKALAYVLAIIFLPVAGMVFYFVFGTNYRKRKIYSRKLLADDHQSRRLEAAIQRKSLSLIAGGNEVVQSHKGIARLLLKENMSPLTGGNKVELLVNGELKFPRVLEALKNAKNHIHMEYYIYEDDGIGREIEQILKQKAAEGVEVRLIYDDFGSRSIRKKLVPRLKAAGVQAYPFYEIIFLALANRLNYRNHRKIIVVDGCIGFIGGINVSDGYINALDKQPGKLKKKKLFWRDSHVRIEGAGVHYLQHLFLCDWNFCARQSIIPSPDYFPRLNGSDTEGKYVQIAASGPDSDNPTILFSLLQAIHQAAHELLITTPYFIPEQAVIDALRIASLSGVKVKLLVPGKSDSRIVNAAARSFYGDLLDVGVDIYLYQKGFIHAKTLVVDRRLSIIGSANMDYRSFDLNFEANAIVYDESFGTELAKSFYDDLEGAVKIDTFQWEQRFWLQKLLEKAVRLIAPLL
ncbi:cardiolipin synthase [Arachidicoccus rhizosphaerae]|uniref:Cardiolipin synthase n=1 Tax=Arachidicoccus rhizosphaerae TaxID=551991 RepID=A0A1H3VHN7_9BACT|nr:cardiolipin synthase [Arachidicoccus rhizosphaerae]SDZ74287.1 cardiolipin synthase [Arachidicoccus rhizosphaerae]